MSVEELTNPYTVERREEPQEASKRNESGELVPSIRVEAVLDVRTRIIEIAEKGLRLLFAADTMAVESGFGSSWEAISRSFHQSDRWTCRYDGNKLRGHCHDPVLRQIDSIRASVDAGGWDLLMKETGVWTFMDAKSREDWHRSIDNKETPALDMASIQATFQRLYEERGKMVEQGVVLLFRSLSWDYKSNLPVMFGKRLVMDKAFVKREPDRRGAGQGWYPERRTGNHIDDLVRQLRRYDGLPEHDHRSSASRWIDEPDTSGAPWEGYFELRRFNNGNAHIIFKRMDLIERLNGILAKHYPGALPAPRTNGT
jgi:hypothetical protein